MNTEHPEEVTHAARMADAARCVGPCDSSSTQLRCGLVLRKRFCDGCGCLLAARMLTDDELHDTNLFTMDTYGPDDVSVGPIVHWGGGDGGVEFCATCVGKDAHLMNDYTPPDDTESDLERLLGPPPSDYCIFCQKHTPGVPNTKGLTSRGAVCDACFSEYEAGRATVDLGKDGVLSRGDAIFKIKGADDDSLEDIGGDPAMFLDVVGSRVSELTDISLITCPLSEWTLLAPLRPLYEPIVPTRDSIKYGVAVHRRAPHQVAVVSAQGRGALMFRAFRSFAEYEAAKAAWQPGDPGLRLKQFKRENFLETSTDFDEWLLLDSDGAVAPQPQNM